MKGYTLFKLMHFSTLHDYNICRSKFALPDNFYQVSRDYFATQRYDYKILSQQLINHIFCLVDNLMYAMPVNIFNCSFPANYVNQYGCKHINFQIRCIRGLYKGWIIKDSKVNFFPQIKSILKASYLKLQKIPTCFCFLLW